VATIVLTQIGRANPQGKVAMHILWTIIIGFIAGVIAKFITPGKNEPSGFILTTILGIVGAFFFSHLPGPGDRLVSRGSRRRPHRSSGRCGNYFIDLGLHCRPPQPVSLAKPGFAVGNFLLIPATKARSSQP
jgi:hypothetical protein